MKSAYFWLQLPSNIQSHSRRVHRSPSLANSIAPEIIQPSLIERMGEQIRSVLVNVKRSLADKLNSPPQLKVRSYLDSQGNTWWYVYDPVTQETEYLNSEVEVQAWLQQHYYHKDRHFLN